MEPTNVAARDSEDAAAKVSRGPSSEQSAESFGIELRSARFSNTKSSTPVSTLTWIVLGTGTAALGATLVAEMAAKNTGGLTRTGAFFGGIGITASVIGGVLLYLDLHEPNVTPTQKGRAFVAGVSGRF